MAYRHVKLGDTVIGVYFHFIENEKRFSIFFTEAKPQYLVEISPSRLMEEKEKMHEVYPGRVFSDIDVEFNALYTEIPSLLFKQDIITFHGVLVEMNNEGYLFTGDSGVGKSTHAGYWTEVFSPDARIINGDKPLLQINEGGVFGYGSPWMGKENIGVNQQIRIKAICFIQRNTNNSVCPLKNNSETVEKLIRQTMIMGREQKLLDLFRWYKNALNYVEIYQLDCTNSKEAALVAFKGMND